MTTLAPDAAMPTTLPPLLAPANASAALRTGASAAFPVPVGPPAAMRSSSAVSGRPVEVAIVLGTRSEAVALAPVVRALRRCAGFSPLVVSTGQQRGVLDQVLRPLGVRPDVDLALARDDDGADGATRASGAAGAPSRLDAADVERLGELLAARRPDVVLVHGDSATAFAAALAACSEGIAVGHLGAGLRGPRHDAVRAMPEEANQRLIAPLARWHLAPTPAAAANLVAEGIDAAAITVTGTTGVDALLWAASLQRGTSAFPGTRPERRGRVLACLRLRDVDRGQIVGLAAALRALAADGLDVVLPVHPDGAPPGLLAELGVAEGRGAVRLVPPMEYLDFVATMRDATAVVTDSGAVQEEAPALGTPVLVVRGSSDRPFGSARPVEPDPERLVRECRRLADDADRPPDAGAPAALGDPSRTSGTGRATERVLDMLTRTFTHVAPPLLPVPPPGPRAAAAGGCPRGHRRPTS